MKQLANSYAKNPHVHMKQLKVENASALTKNRTISRDILNMDSQESYWIENELDKIINSITYTVMNVAQSKDQDNLLNETISHLMEAQSNLNKYVNNKNLTKI